MNLDFISEVWDALRSHVDLSEREYAADTLVNLLIEHNYEADDIKEAFRGDKEIISALKEYIAEHDPEIDDEFEEEFEEDDEW